MNTYFYREENISFYGFAPEELYRGASKYFVLYCVDILLINRARRTVYLVKRRFEPMRGWWYFGGRVRPGEKDREAACRIMKEESGLLVDKSRFEGPIMEVRYFWEGGYDGLVHVFALEVSLEEISRITRNQKMDSFDSKPIEYSFKDLQNEGIFHQSLRDSYRCVFGI